MNYEDLIDMVGEMAGVSANDPWRARVGPLVNRALQDIVAYNPSGWDWLWRDIRSETWDADRTEFTFTELGAFLDPVSTVYRVLSVAVTQTADGVTWGNDLGPRTNRRNLESPMGSMPFTGVVAWGVEHQALMIRAVPSGDIGFSARVLIDEPALVDLDDEPILPARYHTTLAMMTEAYVYRMKQDESRSKFLMDNAEVSLRRMMASSRPWGGGGSTPIGGD